MQFHFILVSPQLAENVGAAARAMNTMGFANLRLVSPCDHLDERARWMAYGSNHILEKATTFASFDA
ncbi:tRNA/rRNA methyltransferase, partial [candidate division KSB1 bacterium]|nr:tRNA/rRNA methyltransferase [candidate division KSB1 bacterium]